MYHLKWIILSSLFIICFASTSKASTAILNASLVEFQGSTMDRNTDAILSEKEQAKKERLEKRLNKIRARIEKGNSHQSKGALFWGLTLFIVGGALGLLALLGLGTMVGTIAWSIGIFLLPIGFAMALIGFVVLIIQFFTWLFH